MKILHLLPYLPTPANFGGALRVYHILKHLVANHDVTVAGFCEHGDLEKFKTAFPELKGKMHLMHRWWEKYHRLHQLRSFFTPHSYWYNWPKSKKFEQMVRRLVQEQSFDVIISEFPTMGHFDIPGSAIRILDAHNVEFDNFRRMSMIKGDPLRKIFYTREYNKSYQEEVEAFNRHDAIFVTSQRDGELIKQEAPTPDRYVIPNGVEMSYFLPNKVTPDPYTMVFTGSMDYLPNNEGIMYFLEEIFPIIKNQVPQAKVYIVGKNPPQVLRDYASDSVIITGFVDDVRPYVDRAQLFVVPLNMGSGTRLKVLEAFSMQKPVVSTSIGCEGLEVDDDIHLLVRDEPAAFAEAVIQLFEDQEHQQRLVTNGYQLVEEKYDWSVVGQAIESALTDVMRLKYNIRTNGTTAALPMDK